MIEKRVPKQSQVWLAVFACACFVVATVTNVVGHHAVIAIFTGLAAACNFMLAALHLHGRRATPGSSK